VEASALIANLGGNSELKISTGGNIGRENCPCYLDAPNITVSAAKIPLSLSLSLSLSLCAFRHHFPGKALGRELIDGN
jgi:hypothetical protein